MELGIVGAGITGLTAAYELGKAGHKVVLFEKDEQPGGLSATFRDERWEWPLEKFYHHLFESDHSVLSLSRELGLGDKIVFPRPITAIWQKGTVNAFDSPAAVLRYPYLTFVDKMRIGLVTLYLRLTKNWQPMERATAHEWLPRYLGARAYKVLWEPLLANKMGAHYKQVNMAWFWARIHKRSFRLGYYVGGYQTLLDALAEQVHRQGAALHLGALVTEVGGCARESASASGESGRICLRAGGHVYGFDAVLVTTSPQVMLGLATSLPPAYLEQLGALRSLGGVALVLALNRPMTKGFYWINLPQGQFPFLAFVEHTNYQSPVHYGGDHIVYLGDYPEAGAPHMTMSKEELLHEFLPHLTSFNPSFDPSWVRKTWLFREEYAQPVPPVNYSKQIPSIRTPLSRLYFASMSQVYPWDRGSNYAVEMGETLARMVQEDWVVRPT